MFNALNHCATGFATLSKHCYIQLKYVLTGHLQSDRIEAEFGIYRQQSGGNYNISVQQVANSLGLQRLKLFNKLDLEQSHVHIANDC